MKRFALIASVLVLGSFAQANPPAHQATPVAPSATETPAAPADGKAAAATPAAGMTDADAKTACKGAKGKKAHADCMAEHTGKATK
jgi:hypothetical protein